MEKTLELYLNVNPDVKPMHDNQHAYRKGRSTESALHQLISQIEHGHENGLITLAIFLDISGAFDCASFHALEEAMREFRIPEVIRRWLTLDDLVSSGLLGFQLARVCVRCACSGLALRATVNREREAPKGAQAYTSEVVASRGLLSPFSTGDG